jgi:hypothetical protein
MAKTLTGVQAALVIEAILLIFVTIKVTHTTALRMKYINIKYGEMHISGYNSCQINNNGNSQNIHVNGGEITLPGLYFGLVTYICDIDAGTIISKFICKECGVFCTYNEYIEGCEQTAFKMALGIIIGLLIATCLFLPILYFCNRKAHKILHDIVYWFYNRSDKHRLNKSAKIQKLTGLHSFPKLKEPKVLSDEKRVKLQAKRIQRKAKHFDIGHPMYKTTEVLPIVGNNSPTSSELNSGIDETKFMTEAEIMEDVKKSRQAMKRRKSNSSTSSLSTAAIGAAILLTHTIPANCCDKVMYLFSGNRICDDHGCNDVKTFTFQLRSGSTICFRDSNDVVTSYRITNMEYVDRYALQYYTQNYTIEHWTRWNCLGSGHCWDCESNFKHPDFKSLGEPEGFGCLVGPASCDNYCFRASACTFFHWHLKAEGTKYGVYERISRVWSATVVVERNGTISTNNLNANNPSLNLNDHDIHNANLPMTISSFMAEDLMVDDFVVVIDNAAYGVQASKKNQPAHEMIGDFQVDTYGKSQTFALSKLNIIQHNCKLSTQLQEPTISRLLRDKSKTKKYDNINFIMGKENLDVKTRVMGTVQVYTHGRDFQNVYVKKPECKIDLVMTYGCKACNELPYAVFQAYDIKEPGVLPYESNCTFTKNYLSCSQDPFSLTLNGNYPACTIFIPDLNITIKFDVDYKYLGTLSPMRLMSPKEGTLDAMISALFSGDVLSTIAKTTLIATLTSTVITMVVKVFQVFAAKKVEHDVETVP